MKPLCRLKSDPNLLMAVGMVFLAASLMWPRYIPGAAVRQERVDAIQGLLVGISIGLNLCCLRLKALSRRGSGS
jgi:hypothetical protein